MNVLECITTRRSVRQFQAAPVSADAVARLLEAGRWAPTPANLQFRRFIVVQDPGTIRKLAQATLDQPFVATVPLVIVGCANPQEASETLGARGPLLATQEVAASVENILLAAHAEGLGACWVGLFDDKKVAALLPCPRHLVPVALVAIGHCKGIPSAPERLSLGAITIWVRTGTASEDVSVAVNESGDNNANTQDR